jgi:hypothetical protein
MSVNNFIPDDGSLWSIRALDISGNYNQKLNFDASGNAIIQTGNTDRLTINSSGAWTCQGGMSYNNTTNALTATTFIGDLSGNATTATITDTNTDAVFYPTFVSGTGSTQTLRADATTGAFSINPFNGNLNVADTFKITQTSVSLGKSAGLTGQGINAVAIGTSAGLTTQGEGGVAIGNTAGQTAQLAGAVAVGQIAGNANQGSNAVAVGNSAGQTTQGARAVAIGVLAGATTQGSRCVAIGNTAGQTAQLTGAVAVGQIAGNANQGVNAVAVGNSAGETTQGTSAVAVGVLAGQTTQGANAVAIGNLAGQTNQFAGSICLNASGVAVNPAAAGFFVNPIRNVDVTNVVGYNTGTSEVTYFDETNLFGVGTPIAYSPVISDAGGNLNSGSYSVRVSEYIKIGKLVFYQGSISITAKTGLTAANTLRLSIPFTSDAIDANFIQSFTIGRMDGMTTTIVSVSATILPNTDFMTFNFRDVTSANSAAMLVSNISTTWNCRFGGFYFANA